MDIFGHDIDIDGDTIYVLQVGAESNASNDITMKYGVLETKYYMLQ